MTSILIVGVGVGLYFVTARPAILSDAAKQVKLYTDAFKAGWNKKEEENND